MVIPISFHSHRKILKEENKLNAFVAGALSGLSILWIDRGQRATIAVYLLVRALRIVWVAASQEDWFPKILKHFRNGDAVLMVMTACQILYGYIFFQDSLPSSYLKFLVGAGRLRLIAKMLRLLMFAFL